MATLSKHAQQEADQAVDRYRALFNHMQQGFCIIEMYFDDAGEANDCRFLEVNPVFEQQTGLKDAAGRKMSELGPPLEKSWFMYYGEVAKTRKPIHFENNAAYLVGGAWYEVHAYPVDSPEEHHVAVLFNDITERKRAEEAQRQKEERAAFLLRLNEGVQHLSDPDEIQAVVARLLGEHLNANRVIYIELDLEKRQAYVQRDYHRHADDVSLVGQYDFLDFPTLAAVVDAGGKLQVPDAANSDILTAGEKAFFASFQIGAFVQLPLLKSGRVTAEFLVTSRQPRNWTEEELSIIAETTERTWDAVERARAEEALRQSEEKLRVFISATSDTLYKMSADWKYMLNLEGKDFLTSTDKPSDKWFDLYIPKEEQPAVLHTISEAIRLKIPFEMEHRVYQADGSIGWGFSRAIPLLNKQGEITEWFGAASDITQRKLAEQQLKEFNAQLEQENLQMRLAQQKALLLAIMQTQEEERRRISEALHNGVGQILYAAKIHLDHLQGQSINGLPAVQQTLDLVDEILEQAINQTRNISHELTPAVLEHFGLETAFREICTSLNSKPLQVQCRVADLPDTLRGYLQIAVYRIAQELATNIVKHAQATEASLQLYRQQNGMLVLIAEDNGLGFCPSQLPGTGIGLQSIKDRVKLLNGTITIDSSPGNGTLVEIKIPVQEQ